jgi:hypothetical protein
MISNKSPKTRYCVFLFFCFSFSTFFIDLYSFLSHNSLVLEPKFLSVLSLVYVFLSC